MASSRSLEAVHASSCTVLTLVRSRACRTRSFRPFQCSSRRCQRVLAVLRPEAGGRCWLVRGPSGNRCCLQPGPPGEAAACPGSGLLARVGLVCGKTLCCPCCGMLSMHTTSRHALWPKAPCTPNIEPAVPELEAPAIQEVSNRIGALKPEERQGYEDGLQGGALLRVLCSERPGLELCSTLGMHLSMSPRS